MNLEKFAQFMGSIQENFIEKHQLSFYSVFYNNQYLKSNTLLTSRMIALCRKLRESVEFDASQPALRAVEHVLSENKLGPIVFHTPELGRWSTVGGLGVMVDELSIGLAQRGEEVIVISPYYERNRKGETGYLARDPAGISYKFNVAIKL